MDSSHFMIDLVDLYWIKGEKDNPEDLCLHGNVDVKIGDEVVADNYSCTVSSTGLYLLKSIEEDHIPGKSLNQLLPCCGHFIIPDDTKDTVEIYGCPNGIDWSVLHSNESVKLVTQKGNEVSIKLTDYRGIVFDFADKIEAYYKMCKEKVVPTDEIERNGYIKFWREWHIRRDSYNLK